MNDIDPMLAQAIVDIYDAEVAKHPEGIKHSEAEANCRPHVMELLWQIRVREAVDAALANCGIALADLAPGVYDELVSSFAMEFRGRSKGEANE